MPRYQITAPDGREVTIEGPRPPTQEDAAKIFAELPPPKGIPKDTLSGKRKPAPAEIDKPRDAGGLLADMALEGGGAAGGQALGALAAPYTFGASIPVGGAIGGVAGNLASQKRRILAGEQSGYRPGEALASAVTGAIPGAPLAASGGKAMLREGAKQAAGGVLARTIETGVDEGRFPSAQEFALVSALPAVGGAIGQRIQAANPAIQAAIKEAEAGDGAAIRAIVKKGREEGYKVPGSLVRKAVGAPASIVGDTMESFGGKAAVVQQAIIDNQPITNRLGKRAIGLSDSGDITDAALDRVREKAAKPYEEIEAMASKARGAKSEIEAKTVSSSSHEQEAARALPENAEKLRSLTTQSAADVEALKKARNTATLKYRQYSRSADPDHLNQAEAAAAEAALLESRIEKAAEEFGAPDLLNRLREGRMMYARTYDIERAINPATRNIDPQKLAAMKRAGRPLTGELETIADMALTFDQFMKEGTKGGSPGVSAFQVAGMIGGALAGNQAAGLPGTLVGALPLARPAARSLVLSEPYQNFRTQIPLSVDASPDRRAVLAHALAQESAQEIADEVEPKKKK